MGKEAAKAKEIVRGLAAKILEEVDSLVDLDTQGDYNTTELQRTLGERCAKAEARIAELDRSETELIGQRDHAEEWADKLSEAIALHFRQDIGEHSSSNNPWAEALNLISGTSVADVHPHDPSRRIR